MCMKPFEVLKKTGDFCEVMEGIDLDTAWSVIFAGMTVSYGADWFQRVAMFGLKKHVKDDGKTPFDGIKTE